MRDYKFRGKRVDTGEWVYGFIIIRPGDKEIITIYDIENGTAYEVYKNTVGQSINKLDKNKKEIFEGDMFYYDEDLCLIAYDEEECKVVVQIYGKEQYIGENGQECYTNNIKLFDTLNIDEFDFSSIEIIGNKTDNPELLEVE